MRRKPELSLSVSFITGVYHGLFGALFYGVATDVVDSPGASERMLVETLLVSPAPFEALGKGFPKFSEAHLF